MYRLYIILCLSLFLFSCKNDDGILETSVLTVEVPDIFFPSDQLFRASISDLEGNVLDTQPLNENGITELGLFIKEKDRPEKVHLHIIREELHDNNEILYIETFAEIEVGSTIPYNYLQTGTSVDRARATVNLGNTNGRISPQRDRSFASGGFTSVPFRESLTMPDQYYSSVESRRGAPFSVYASYRMEADPSTYFWNLRTGVQDGDTLMFESGDFNQITPAQQATLPVSTESWSLIIEGQTDNAYYPVFESRRNGPMDKAEYFTPGDAFDQYYTRYSWQDADRKIEEVLTTTKVSEPFGRETGIDITIQDKNINNFQFSATGPIDYVRSRWSYTERINNSAKDIFWFVYSPSVPETGSLSIPVISAGWTSDLSWPANAELILNYCEAVDVSWLTDYKEVVPYLSNYDNQLGPYERPALGESITKVFPVIP